MIILLEESSVVPYFPTRSHANQISNFDLAQTWIKVQYVVWYGYMETWDNKFLYMQYKKSSL